MKRVFKKNQIIIAALAVMIAVAGYLNYSGKIFHEKDGGAEEANADLANQELLDISEEDIETVGDEIASNDSDVEGTPGEAVLTNGSAETTVAQAKVTREQVRAQNKETLQAIIDNTNLSESEKQEAVSQLVQMTQIAEQEAAVETMMASKGFSEAVVSIDADSADIVVKAEELTDANRAQIEDIVTRKTKIAPQNIANPEGSAFLGSAQMYDGCINDSSLVVNILGGTLKSVNGNAVTIYNTEEKSDVRADISVTGGSLQPAAGKGAVKVITSGDNTTRFDPDKKTLDTMKSNTTVKVAKDVAAAATDRDGKTTYYNTVEEALGSNTEDGNIHIYINENSSVKQEALEGENVILTVAPGVVLEVTSGIDGMIVKETVHEDGSKTYELVNAEELSAPKNVTVTADCKTVHIGKKIRLKASAEHDTKQVNYLYRWYKDGALLNGAVSAELEVTESGNYAVEVFAVLEKDGTTLTSLGAKSDPVKCTVTPHEYEEKWSSDGKVHWHECTICKNKTDVAEHTFGEWKVTEKATEKKDGRKERSCTVCGHKETAVIKAAGKTEEPRKESDKTASVKTGDKTDPAVYIFFVILTGGMIAILSAGNRKNRRK